MRDMDRVIDAPQGRASDRLPLREVPLRQLQEILEAHRKWVKSKGRQGKRADLAGANLHGADLAGANLHGADLREVFLSAANLNGADLRGADLRGADLFAAFVHGAELRGADLRAANLRAAYLHHGPNLRTAHVFVANLIMRKVERSLSKRSSPATLNLILIIKNLIYRWRQYLDRRLDKEFLLDTSGHMELADLDIDSDNKEFGSHYEPTPVRILRSIFSNLPDDLSEFIFIDFGSGKGRTLLVSSDYNFKRIIGVEFSKELHPIAQNNIRAYRSKKQRSFDIESVCMDATTFPIPTEKSIFYFSDPFSEEVMLQVLNNIKKSYLDNPRKIFITYHFPRLSYLIDDLGFMQQVETKPIPTDFLRSYRWGGVAIYESHPCTALDASVVTIEATRGCGSENPVIIR